MCARSLARDSAGLTGGAALRCASRLLRKSNGSASSRSRTSPRAALKAARSPVISRLVNPCSAAARARRRPLSRSRRTSGTRSFIAALAGIFPVRTRPWISSGSSSTRARWRETQLALRLRRRAISAAERPRRRSCDNSQPCSNAVSAGAVRRPRAKSRASPSLIPHTTVRTTSTPKRRSARIRL